MTLARALSALLLLVFFAAACGGEQYQTPGDQAQGGDYTGLLINAQEPGRRVFATALEKWSVVDTSRSPIFTSDEVQTRRGVLYEKRLKEALSNGRGYFGKHHYEVKVMKCEYEEPGWKSAVFVVDDATAGELRAIPNLATLVQQEKVVLLMGQIGD